MSFQAKFVEQDLEFQSTIKDWISMCVYNIEELIVFMFSCQIDLYLPPQESY